MDPKTFVDLLLEVDQLEDFPRAGFLKRAVARPESVAAHCFGMALTSMMLADLIPESDKEKVMRMALLHEMGEVHLTDLPRIAGEYITVEVKENAEHRAAADLLAPLGELGDSYLALFDEFLAGETLEARIVRSADKIQMMAKVLRYELAGYRLVAEFWDYVDNLIDHDLPLAADLFAEIEARRPTNG